MVFIDELSSDKPHDHCGVFGVFGHKDAAHLTYLGLYSLQHRGQESAGIVSSDGYELFDHRSMGLVVNVFDEDILKKLKGHMAIGHNRYSTAGSSTLKNAQPLIIHSYSKGPLAIGHNGNLVNAPRIRRELEERGTIFNTTSDTEVIALLAMKSQQATLEDRIIDALKEVRGAYSLVIMDYKTLIAARDPWGFRPLWLGKLKDAILVASETCAFDIVDANPIREVEPGEMVIINKNGLRSVRISPPSRHAFCIFEYIYLARPDSEIFGHLVNPYRREFGRQLAREHPAEADIVIAVPDSANISALGYSQESGIPYEIGFNRNHYVGRTFIHPTQKMRDAMVKIKLNPIRDVLYNKRVVLVEDSIMRGTNARKVVKMLRRGGAKEVHFRVASPPNRFPCYYGIDTPTRQELIANSHTIEEIKKYIHADSLGYLSIEGMLHCVKKPYEFCTACFDGKYPVEFSGQNIQQLSLEFTRDRKRD